MKRLFLLAFAAVAAAVAVADQNIIVPGTSVARPEDAGRFAHTNHLIYVGPWNRFEDPAPLFASHGPALNALFAGPSGLWPSDLRTAYGLPATGGSGAIAIVDAYHYGTALNDFNFFAGQFGLPKETSTNATSSSNSVFQVVYASGKQPRSDPGWALEAAMDIEWAHAMAPNAKIYLVEAATNSLADLSQAEKVAAGLVGVKQVSNSWGSNEYSSESGQDGTYVHSGVVFFASGGDSGGVRSYPACSPNVVSCGGTTLRMSGGAFVSETAWSSTGCGPSAYEPRPAYQDAVSLIVGNARGTDDISAVADPNTGAAVYDTTRYQGRQGWWVVGGTSLSCPVLAGVANLSGVSRASSADQLSAIYSKLGTGSFRDITSGTAGSFSASTGYDFPTGVGTPQGLTGF